jgi:cytochrome b subunit of formate dehydrogenase
VVHAFVIVSFLGLAATGAPLKFAHTAWAQGIFAVIGGVSAAGWWHRLFAIITFGYFSAHVFYMARKLWRHSRSGTLRKALLGPDSLVPRLSDARDIVAHVRWFVGAGPRPTWDRWTYWEKFDYWAVFWGVAIIGASGVMLWFPAFFSSFLPGWIINIALIIHSDEALLAIGFIFGVHFFNSHLRRNKSPWTRSSSPAPFRRRSTARSADANGPAWRPRAGSRSAGESRPARPSSGGCTSSASWPG